MINYASGRRGGRPNVVVFFTDQQRWDSTGLGGNPLGLTPNFDRMAREGTHVPAAFTMQPVCGPARACLQTGLYATANGCHTNGIGLNPQHRTLAQHFNGAGYHTGYIGKWHLAGDGFPVGPVPEAKRGGYQYWLAAELLEFVSDDHCCILYDNEDREVRLPGYRVDALTDAAIRYIDRQKDDPFFLFLSFLEPHHQNYRDDYPAPIGYAERYTDGWTPPDLKALVGNAPQSLGGYWGMIKRLDEALGRLLDALKSLDLLDNTIVLFTSDHGCHFKTRNGEYKRSCHESSIRVPLAIRGPGFDGGGTVRELVSLIDLPPTLLDAAGIRVPPEHQGRSLLPLLSRQQVDWPEEVFVQISESQLGRAVRTRRWKYGVNAPDKRGKDMFAEVYEEQYLYDLLADPYELKNLVGLKPFAEVAEVMRGRLLRRMTAAGEPPATIKAAPELNQWSGRRVSSAEAHQ